MADDKDVQEQTIADESVLKKYKEAGEIVNSWVECQKFPPKNSTRQSNNIKSCFYQSAKRIFATVIVCGARTKGYRCKIVPRVVQLLVNFVHQIYISNLNPNAISTFSRKLSRCCW